jgi:hypothetical protein
MTEEGLCLAAVLIGLVGERFSKDLSPCMLVLGRIVLAAGLFGGVCLALT